jgi:3-hydroxypropanoate dehydrogenase
MSPMSGFDNAKVDVEFFGAGKATDESEQEFFPEGQPAKVSAVDIPAESGWLDSVSLARFARLDRYAVEQRARDSRFQPHNGLKSNFLCNLGYGDRSRLQPRNPRLDFEEACALL